MICYGDFIITPNSYQTQGLEICCRTIHATSVPLLGVWQIELEELNSLWMAKPTNCQLMITGTHSTVYLFIYIHTNTLKFLITHTLTCIVFIFWLIIDEIAINRLTTCTYEISGGTRGFSDVVWTVKSHRKDSHITFTYNSFDNEEGTFFN